MSLTSVRAPAVAQVGDVEQTRDDALDASVLEVVPRLMPRLYGYARYRLARQDAEDAVGAALERIWRKRQKWRAADGGQIAELLSTTPGAVAVALHRAISKVRANLSK
jgi:DNA-directed RNA polymerase specialized sigma24 family protein